MRSPRQGRTLTVHLSKTTGFEFLSEKEHPTRFDVAKFRRESAFPGILKLFRTFAFGSVPAGNRKKIREEEREAEIKFSVEKKSFCRERTPPERGCAVSRNRKWPSGRTRRGGVRPMHDRHRRHRRNQEQEILNGDPSDIGRLLAGFPLRGGPPSCPPWGPGSWTPIDPQREEERSQGAFFCSKLF